ncbi:MAG: hypothetical protein ABFQ62_04495 [Patescibacteria group bacterium]
MSFVDKIFEIIVGKVYAADDVFGTLEAPQGVADYNQQAGGADAIGIILFASNAIKLFTVVAGIYVLYNFVRAGLSLVSGGGKSDKYSEATNKMTMSVIGIILIAASYTIAGLIGLIVFGDATYILNPKICGPAGC